MKCRICKKTACVGLRSHNTAFCEDCFLQFFQRQIERGIEKEHLFTKDDRILVAISGGKDSLALLYELNHLGYNVTGLHIDLAIQGSSDTAREAVERFCQKHALPLIVLATSDYDLAIPTVKASVRRPICSACGTIKRYFFNKVAIDQHFTVLATGHTLDDEVARLLSNTLRWDPSYLATQGPLLPAENGFVRKVKPLWRLSEYETATFCFLLGIENTHTVCPYSQGASFTVLKKLLNNLEATMPGRKIDFYQGFLERGKPHFRTMAPTNANLRPCIQCGYPTSNDDMCGVCHMRTLVRARKGEAHKDKTELEEEKGE